MFQTFQSPQWGNNSKVELGILNRGIEDRFSPRNGEIILKIEHSYYHKMKDGCFSPRNGEIILKDSRYSLHLGPLVSVPAMGK